MIENTSLWELNCQGQSRKRSTLIVSSLPPVSVIILSLWPLLSSLGHYFLASLLLTQYTASPTGRDIADTSITERRQPYLEVMPCSWVSLNAGQPGVPILMRVQWTSSPRQMGEIFWKELCSPSSFSFLSHCSWVKLVFLLLPPFVIILHREALLFLVGTQSSHHFSLPRPSWILGNTQIWQNLKQLCTSSWKCMLQIEC